MTLDITALAAGGDGVARDEAGRVTFVPRTAPGDRVRARLVHATASFARAELVELLAPSPARIEPPCPHFTRGCGGCAWQHVARGEQLAAKQAIVAGALRKLSGLALHPIADPAPPLHWRRRARFHVVGGKVGLYQEGTHRVLELVQPARDAATAGRGGTTQVGTAEVGTTQVDTARGGTARLDGTGPLDACPQLEPALEAVLVRVAAAAAPPDGELALLRGYRGDVAIGVSEAWRGVEGLVGQVGVVGVVAGEASYGEPVLEVEPGLWGGPWDFAQASAAGNAALIACTRAAVGRGPGRLLELYAGAGNLTRGLVEDGWAVTATDVVAPARPVAAEHLVGPAREVIARLAGPYDAIVLDPPRAGAAEAIDGIVRLAPPTIVYVSCDPATLARDAARLVAAGYTATDAWPIDLMPQTAHVEVVLRLVRA